MRSEVGVQVGFEHGFPADHKLYFYSLPTVFPVIQQRPLWKVWK